MSLVRSNRPNFRLRPVGVLFVVLSSIFVFTQVISPVTAVITAKYETDKNWIKLDSNFPSTKNALGQVEPFFYARGLFDEKMNLTQKFVDDNFGESKGITDFHVKFQVWRNKVKCNKYFSAGTEVDTNTNIDEAVWYRFEKRYSAKEFRDFTIWLAANRECEHSLMAIRDLTLSYNSYVKAGDDTPVKKVEEFKVIEKLPDSLVPPTDTQVHQYYFSGCEIVDACSLNIKLTTIHDTKLTFWNSKVATLTIKDHSAKTSESNTAAVVELKDLKIPDLSFHIKTTDSSIVVLKIESVDPTKPVVFSETNKTKAFEIHSSLVSKFITEHNGKHVHLLPHHIDNSSVYLNVETPAKDAAKACYKLTYLVEDPIHERFSVTIDSHGAEFVHRYKLFDFLPIIGTEQYVEFCIADFIYDLSKVLTGNVQFVLETKGSNTIDQSLIPKMTVVFIEKSATIEENKDVKYFIAETDEIQWNSILPGEIVDVPRANDPISIGANVNQPQSKQISSVWLKNDPNLNLRPVIVRLKANKPISDVGTQMKVEAFICDEIMECIKMTQAEKVTADTVEYSLQFDAHPNQKSQFVKLMLNVELPSGAGADISLINFGNPCYSGGCSGNRVCKSQATLPPTLKANAFADACECSPKFTGPNCDVQDFCAKNLPGDPVKCPLTESQGCANNFDNTGYECKCDSSTALQLGNSGKCVARTTDKMDHTAGSKKYSWSIDLSAINPHIYDICYKFAPKLDEAKVPDPAPVPLPAAKQIEGKISVVYSDKPSTSERQIILVDAQSFHLTEGAPTESVIVDLCLSKLLDVTKDAKLTVTVDTSDESSFKDAHSHLYAKLIEKQAKPETRSLEFNQVITLPKNLMKVEALKDKKQVIYFEDTVTDLKQHSKIVLYSEWIVNHPKLAAAKIANNLLELVEQDAKSKEYLGHKIEICRPLTGSAGDCVLYEKNLDKILPSLNSDKFHIKITVELLKDVAAADLKVSKLNLQVSLWDACQVEQGPSKCQNKAVCKSGSDVSTFTCVETLDKETCPGTFTGVFCEISDSCTAANKAECEKHNAKCVPLVDNKFTCDCPSGYHYDSTHKKCDRMKVDPITYKCDLKNCFINGITSSPFTYLSAHFPQYDSADNRDLYYTVQSDSKITISVEDLTKTLSVRNEHNLENDVCVKFRYFVAPDARLSLRYEDQIQLQVIDGVSLINPTITQNGQQTQASLDMSAPTKICLKALLALNKLHNVDKFKLVFVSQTSSPDHAIVVEMLRSDDLNWVETPADLLIPNTYLRYLGQNAHSLNVTGMEKFSYLWPVVFPTSRWERSPDSSDKILASSLELTREQRNTIETAYLESSWIERSLRSNQPAVYLTFNMEIDSSKKEDLNVDIYLIDSDRNSLGKVGSVSSSDFKEGAPVKDHRNGHFVFQLNRFEIEQTKSYKVQFKINYHDKMPDASVANPLKYLLKISDISFGDPCIHVSPSENTAKSQICYTVLQGEPGKVNPEPACKRVQLANTIMDYQCDCHESLLGKDCSKVDRCKFSHTIYVNDSVHTHQRQEFKEITGDQFCLDAKKGTGKIATCKPGRIVHVGTVYEFLCECNDKLTPHRFNIETQQCVPVDQCIVKPCNLETERCVEIKNDKNEVHTQCTCKPFYSKAPNATACTPTYLHEQNECNVETECGTKDRHMKCLAGNGFNVCKCSNGFKYFKDGDKEPKCVSNYCEYPGYHKCPQKCNPLDTEPFYECTCHEDYDLVKGGDAANPTFACNLKPNRCQNCNGKYRVCNNGVCGCEGNFVLDTKGENCVPPASHKISSCPNGRFKIDSLNEVVCDCAYPAGNSTRGYFVAEQTKGTCKLEKTICHDGEEGRNFCGKREAGCVIMDPSKYDDYSCQCKLGKLFPDGKRIKKYSDIRDKVVCLDICDLPYKKSQCAGIGAKCNPVKLWTFAKDQTIEAIQNVKPNEFCDCIPGTFYDDTADVNACVQEPQALLLNISLRWSHELQKEFDDVSYELITKNAALLDELGNPANEFSMDNIDPLGYGRAWIRINQLNRDAEKEIEAEWNSLMRESWLFKEAENLLYSLKLIEHHSDGGSTLVRHDAKIISKPELVNGHYVLSLAVKISPDFRISTDAVYAEADEEEMPAGQNAVTSAPAATTTAAPTTTTKPDPNNPLAAFNLAAFKDITSNCQKLAGTDNCIIPYMSLVLASNTDPTPVLHKPCLQVETCEGLSDCVPQSGSQFECACNANYFDVESRYTFKAHDSIVFKNDRCKSRALCSEKCQTTQTNRECIEKDPVRSHENDTFIWKKDVHCGCAAHFGEATPAPAGQLPQCTAVCSIAACTSNGKCKGEAHSASCECEEGYYGLRCEHAPASVTGWIVAVALLAVLTLVGVGAAIFFWRSSSESTTSHSSSSSLTRTTSNRANQPIRRNSHKTFANLQDMPNSQPKSTSHINLSHNLDSNVHHSNVSLEPQTSSELATTATHSTTIVTSANNKSYEVRQVEASNQQSSASAAVATVVAASSVSSFAKPKDHRLEQIYAEEKLSQKSFSQNSQTDDASSVYSGLKFTAARGSFISADMNSLDFSRQESEDSLTVNEPFTPSPTSPLSQLTNQQQSPQHHVTHPHLYQRRSISVRRPSSPHPIAIAEKNELLYSQIKDELRVNQKSTNDNQNKSFSHSTSSSSSNSLSSDSLSQSNGQPPTIDPPPPPPPAPSPSEESKFTTTNNEPPEPGNPKLEISPSSSSSTSTSTSSASSHRPSTSDSNNNKNLFSDSQEMNQDKFKHVRNKIAAVLRINSFKSYELTKNDDKPLGPR